jgi:hypothetical protein
LAEGGFHPFLNAAQQRLMLWFVTGSCDQDNAIRFPNVRLQRVAPIASITQTDTPDRHVVKQGDGGIPITPIAKIRAAAELVCVASDGTPESAQHRQSKTADDWR